MIISDYSNSVNVTDATLAAQQELVGDADLDDAIESTDALIDHTEEFLRQEFGIAPSPRVQQVEITREFGTAGWPWHWVKRMRPGLLDRTSSESFETELDAALAAERIAICYDAPLGDVARNRLELEHAYGWIMRVFGEPITNCRNQHQIRGYMERMAKESEPDSVEVIDESWYCDAEYEMALAR
jgi:hypothetical protein